MTLKDQYNKMYKNLKRSVYGYVKRGITTSFFQLPKKPKRVTKASIRALEKSIAEWKYYTSQKLTPEEYKMLPANISRQYDRNIAEVSKRVRKMSNITKEVEDAIKDYRRELEEKIAERNKDNPDYQKMIDMGFDASELADVTTNEAADLYDRAERAYAEATAELAKRGNKRNWWLVQQKAETALGAFNNVGLTEYSRLFSFHIKHGEKPYAAIAEEFDQMLYDSEQLDKDERFTKMMQLVIKEPKNMNARERKEYDEILEDLGLT